MTLLVVSSFVRKSGTVSGCRNAAAFGRVLGAAGFTRSRITTTTSYSPGGIEKPRLIRDASPAAALKSTGNIASTGYVGFVTVLTPPP